MKTRPTVGRAKAGNRSSLANDEVTSPDDDVAVESDSEIETIEVPPLSQQNSDLLERLIAELGDDLIIESGVAGRELVIRVKPEAWVASARACKNKLGFDYLGFVAGIDWLPTPAAGGDDAEGDTSAPVQPKEMTFGVAGSAGRFQVFARVGSTKVARYGLTLKVDLKESAPHVDSWCPVFPGADWHERECWEMYGFVFDGHPSLRHLYLPHEFEGFPLRKDFPLLAREVKPWPGLVNVEAMPGVADEDGGE